MFPRVITNHVFIPAELLNGTSDYLEESGVSFVQKRKSVSWSCFVLGALFPLLIA